MLKWLLYCGHLGMLILWLWCVWENKAILGVLSLVLSVLLLHVGSELSTSSTRKERK